MNPFDNSDAPNSISEWAAAKNKKVELVVPTPPAEPTPVAEPAAQTPPAEPENPPTTNQPPTPEPEVSWDIDEPKSTETPKLDFKQLGSALELGEVKDESDLIGKVKEVRTKLAALEANPLASVPDEFKDVLEVAKKGDWKSYLASQVIDYTKVDPVQLYEDEFARDNAGRPEYQTDGKFDPAKLNEALDAIPNAVKFGLGRQVQQALIQEQARKKQEVLSQIRQRTEKAEQGLVKATNTLSEVLPVDKYGIKFEAKHSAQIQEGIRNSSLVKKHFGGLTFDDLVAKGADMNAVTRTITLAEHGEKMIKFKSDNSKNLAKKEILDATQNAQISNSGSAPNPGEQTEKKKSFEQKFKEHFASTSKSVLG